MRMYREPAKGLQILLSRTQAGPGRTVKEQQEQTSRNHVQRILLISVIHKESIWLPKWDYPTGYERYVHPHFYICYHATNHFRPISFDFLQCLRIWDLFFANLAKQDSVGTRQKSKARAGRNFTQPRTNIKSHLCSINDGAHQSNYKSRPTINVLECLSDKIT